MELQTQDCTTRPTDNETGAVRRCGYNGCPVELSNETIWRHCETCRKLKAANAIRFVLDPNSPLLTSKEYELERKSRLTEMSGDEILRFMQLLEDEYLYVCKLVKLKGLTPGGAKKPVKTAAEFVEEVRANLAGGTVRAKIQAKSATKADTKIQKLMKLLNTDDPEVARKWMAEDSDEGF